MLAAKDITNQIITDDCTLLAALERLNRNAGGVLAVVDSGQRLLGTLTDGDIRRAILKGQQLTASVTAAMMTSPCAVSNDTEANVAHALMLARNLNFLPVVDAAGVLLGAVIAGKCGGRRELPNYAVIMCGGLGSRLGELTRNCPKPMLRIGGVPILERIMKGIIACGITRFFFATNYLREKIEGYFGDGSRFNAQIDYLREDRRLGTGGALSLLPFVPETPLLIMNGDILTDVEFNRLLDFHAESGGLATMGIVEFAYQNPYGVIRHENGRLLGIDEKPVQSWFINSGIYVVNPELLAAIPHNTYIGMPTILLEAMTNGHKINVYPIYENWLDIGRDDDFKLAQTLI